MKRTNPSNLDKNEDSIVAFLSSKQPQANPQNKRLKSGPLINQFIREVTEEITQQDLDNNQRTGSSVAEDLMAVIRLVLDNRELIHYIQNGQCTSVSDLASLTGRDLPNISRTLSRLTAYGLVGFEENDKDARSKKPVWLLKTLNHVDHMDWVQAYCLSMVLLNGNIGKEGDSRFSKLEKSIRKILLNPA